MNNNTLKLRFRLLSLLGSIPDATKLEEKEEKLKQEYDELTEFKNSAELQRYENLKAFIESPEFAERKKEINAQKFSDTDEFQKEKRFKELSKDKALRDYLKLHDSEKLNQLNNQIESGKLDRLTELENFFGTDNFKNFRKELDENRKAKTKEYKDALKKYNQLKKKYQWFYDFQNSDDLAFYESFMDSEKLNEYKQLQDEVQQIDLKQLKKEYKKGEREGNYDDDPLVQKANRLNELKQDQEIKRFQKLEKSKKLKKYDQLKDSDEIKEFERLHEYIDSDEFKGLPDEIEKLKFENTNEHKDYEEFKELKNSKDLKDARKLKESKEYSNYQEVKDSELPEEYENLKNYIASDEFKDFKKQMTKKDKFKDSQEYQDYLEYKELKNSQKIKWYFKRKDSTDFDFFRQWEHSFYDNFEGSELDSSKWLTTPFWAKHLLKDSYVQSNDKHFFTNGKNLFVKDGMLEIVTRKEQVKGKAWHPKFGFFPKTFDYTSGMINTAESFRQRYGLFRAKVKVDHVYPFSSSFWLKPDKISPEIDIFAFLDKKSNKVQLNNYWGKFNEEGGVHYHKQKVKGPKFTGKFYIFSLEWTKDELIWKINGVKVKQQTEGVPDIPLYLVLNSGLKAEVSDGQLPSSMHVDWVEVYKARQ